MGSILMDSDQKFKSRLESNFASLLDIEAIDQLLLYGGKDVVIHALEEFLPICDQQIKDVIEANKVNDRLKIKSILHTLKGTAATLGIKKIASNTKTIEEKMKLDINFEFNNQLNDLKKDFIVFQENFNNIISLIHQYNE